MANENQRRPFGVIGVAVAMAAAGLLAPLMSSGPAGAGGGPAGVLAPGDGVLFGAHVQPPTSGDPQQPIVDLEAKLGRRFAIDHYYRTWDAKFPDGREQWAIAGGRIPMISWGKAPTGEINSGRHDKMIRDRARGIRTLGQPVLLRWFWEMGGNRNTAAAGSPQDYVAAWRHLRGIFAEEGASNALWVWCPDASDFTTGVAQSFYPGDADVDWTCADGYNYRHPARQGTSPRSFEETFAAFHAWASERPRPMMVGEYGTVEDAPGDKAAWVTAAHEALKTMLRGVDAVVYFHSVRDREGLVYDWRMYTSESSLQAFKTMGADPWFNPQVPRTLPDTIIDGGPEGPTGSREATFSFWASEPGGGFECRVDAGPFESCESPRSLSGLPDGPHAFEVRALSADGRPDPTQARREWSVDTEGPTVQTVSPADGDTAAPADAAVSATFSEDLDPATVSPTSFTLVTEATGAPVSGQAVYDPASHTARLEPDQDLLPLTSYRATVAAVTDRVGNQMAGDHTWRFTTGVAGGGLPELPGNTPVPPGPPGDEPPGDPPPGDEPPGDQPPGDQPPGDQPPGDQPPDDPPPGDQPPGDQPPGDQPPSPPGDQLPGLPGDMPVLPGPPGDTPAPPGDPGAPEPGARPPGQDAESLT